MLSVISSPADLCRALAERARAQRLERGWTQVELARRTGIAYSTLKHFERTGQISLERLVMIAATLSALDGFDGLLRLPRATSLTQLEARQTKRQRGRRAPR